MTGPIWLKFYTLKDESHVYNAYKFDIDCIKHVEDI